MSSVLFLKFREQDHLGDYFVSSLPSMSFPPFFSFRYFVSVIVYKHLCPSKFLLQESLILFHSENGISIGFVAIEV